MPDQVPEAQAVTPAEQLEAAPECEMAEMVDAADWNRMLAEVRWLQVVRAGGQVVVRVEVERGTRHRVESVRGESVGQTMERALRLARDDYREAGCRNS